MGRVLSRMFGSGLLKFVARRILISIPVLLAIIFATFILIRAVPGGPFDGRGTKTRDPRVIDAMKARYGLDMPLILNFPWDNKPLVSTFRALPDCNLLRQGVSPADQKAKAITDRYDGWYLLRQVTERREQTVVFGSQRLQCWQASTAIYSDLTRSQFFSYVFNVLRFDFGPALGPTYIGQSVSDVIADRLPSSMRLGLLAMVVGVVIGIPLGILTAVRRNSSLDYGVTFFASVLDAIPTLVLGPLMIRFFVLTVSWLPTPKGTPWKTDNIFDGEFIQYAIMPVMTIGIGLAAGLSRLTRSSVLQVLQDDYVRTARAKGMRERGVLYIHVLKNAMIPVATIMGPLLAGLLTGSLIVERIFSVPGIGNAFVESISARDYNLLCGVTILYSVFLILGNLLVDVVYTWLDPRIRFD